MKSLLLSFLLLFTFSLFANNHIILADGSPGIELEIIDGEIWVKSVVKKSHAKECQLQKGMKIIKINNTAIPSLVDHNWITRNQLGPLYSMLELTYLHNNDTINKTIKRDQIANYNQQFEFYIIFKTLGNFAANKISFGYYNHYIQNNEGNISIDSIMQLDSIGIIPDALTHYSTLQINPENVLNKHNVESGDLLISINGKPYIEHSLGELFRVLHSPDTISLEIEASKTKKHKLIKLYEEKDFLHNYEEDIHKSKSFWVIIPVFGRSSADAEYIIETTSNAILDCYYKKSGKLIHLSSTNNKSWLEQQVLGDRNYVKIKPSVNAPKKLYIHLSKMEGESPSSIKIYPWAMALNKDVKNRLIQGLFIGILLIMALYSLMMSVSLKDRNYLLFGLYILFFDLFMMLNKSYLLTWEHPFPMQSLLLLFSMFSFVLYMKYFLQVKSHFPKWDRVLNISLYLILIEIAAFALTSTIRTEKQHIELLAPFFSIISCLILYIILFIPTIKSIKHFNPSLYVLIANVTFVASIFLSLTKNNEVYVQAGVVFQILVFSVSLGQRISNNEKEKNKALKKIVSQLKENDELREKVNRELEGKVKERTEELEHASVEIQAQRDNLKTFNEEISASINYAEKIQRSVLPEESLLVEHLQEHFILFKPRDIVSGDFYWFKKVNNHIIITAADCTGHGVPGAFMSMLGISFLNEIVSKSRFDSSNKILERLRDKIKSALKQKGEIGENKDGMDLAICIIDTETLELQFSGAYNPLYIIRDKEMICLKADRQPIAVYINEKPFSIQHYQLQKDDRLYMFSDGYADQFGGPNAKKFMTKNLKQLLLNYHHLPMNEQKDIFLDKFQTWKGDQEQMDDVLLMGLKI